MQSGNLLGTFRTSGSIPGDGTASAGIYTLLDFSVIQSSFVDIEVGSVSDGTYAFGNQPDYQIDWNGSAVSVFQRGSLGTLYTNGFGINNGAGGAGAYLSFDVGYQAGSAAYGGTSLFTDSTTPAVTPVGSSGMCPGEGDS